jgi:hypothetical protein
MRPGRHRYSAGILLPMNDMTGTWTIDGIDDGVARLAGEGRVVHLPVRDLPQGAREGDVLRMEDEGGSLRVVIDHTAGGVAREEARALLERLGQADPGGQAIP